MDPNRPDDLWEPVAGDPGAHGSFDDRAHSQSWALKLTQSPGMASYRWDDLGHCGFSEE